MSFQALDGDFSVENRNRCLVATAPLLEAVENLSTFANNPEFASIPAQISHEVSACLHLFDFKHDTFLLSKLLNSFHFTGH